MSRKPPQLEERQVAAEDVDPPKEIEHEKTTTEQLIQITEPIQAAENSSNDGVNVVEQELEK